MTDITQESLQKKQEAIDLVAKRYRGMEQRTEDIDLRLRLYFEDLLEHSSAKEDDAGDWHGIYELLGAAKFLRMLDTYNFNTKKVQTVIRLREGEWVPVGKTWKHLSGGLKCPGMGGGQVYRWENFQVFILASIYGFYTWINTQVESGTKSELLRTERERDGWIWDYRRMCTDFTLTGSRKIDKTGLGGFIGAEFMVFEDYNMEGFCCANSEDQAKIIFRRIKYLLSGLDTEKRFRLTESLAAWRDKYSEISTASIRPMTAGGKFKDGWFAQLCLKDEFGAAPYANGKSDMKMLVDVIESSMGPRREPLSVTMTSAGRITEGPFIQILDGLHGMLEREQSIAKGEVQPVLTDDRTMTLLLEPDAWQKEEQYLLTNKTVRHKVNPMLGVIVQHQFYDDQIAKAQRDGDTGEVIAKLFNVYSSGRVTKWLSPEDIRAIQIPQRIDDCTADKGWEVMVGSDFSKGDDLNGNAYLAKRWREDLGEMEYFADLDAYMSEDAVNDNPIKELLLKWAEDGWLHIVPGKTFDPAVAVNRIIELDAKNVNFFGFGYDPYNAKTVINALTQWLCDVGLDPKTLIKPVRQNFATYSPAVKEFDYMVKRGIQQPDGKVTPNPMIHLSPSPLWPWEFGNCQLMESTDGMGNLKPVKANSASSCKVDHVQMVLSALILHDAADGSITPT